MISMNVGFRIYRTAQWDLPNAGYRLIPLQDEIEINYMNHISRGLHPDEYYCLNIH